MFITLPIKDRLNRSTAIWGDSPSLAKEKVAACKKIQILKMGIKVREGLTILSAL